MKLRVCDGERERSGPASLDLLEAAFAYHSMSNGHEIALADGQRWIAAVAVIERPGRQVEFLLSGETGDRVPLSGRTSLGEALQRFRDFLAVESCR